MASTPLTGEYADRIDNADDLLEHFIDAFPEEPIVVRVLSRWPAGLLQLQPAQHLETSFRGALGAHLSQPQGLWLDDSLLPQRLLPVNQMLLCVLQVQLQLVSAAVKLFLKKPTGKPQAMIQLVLTYATQVGTAVGLLPPGCLLSPVVDTVHGTAIT